MKLHLAYQFSVLTGLLTTASSASVPQMDFNPLKFSSGKTRMPYPVSDMTASVAPATSSSLDPLVFIVGGCDSPQGNVRAEWDDSMFYCSTVTDRTIAYDPAQDTFVSKKNMLRERYRHAAAVVNGMIWIIGGRDADDNTVHEVDMYNPLTDEWTYVANMTESLARSDLTAFASSSQTDHFYVTGGYNATYAAFGTTLKIDAAASLSTNEIQYEEQKEMPTPRGDIQSVVLDDNFAYVIGGYTPSNNWCKALTVVEKYNLESNTWTTEPSLTNARGDKAAVLLNDKIYAISVANRTTASVAQKIARQVWIPRIRRSPFYPLTMWKFTTQTILVVGRCCKRFRASGFVSLGLPIPKRVLFSCLVDRSFTAEVVIVSPRRMRCCF